MLLNTVGLFGLMVSDRRIYPPRVVPHQTVESSVCSLFNKSLFFLTAWGKHQVKRLYCSTDASGEGPL
jgi:hypothetical protein